MTQAYEKRPPAPPLAAAALPMGSVEIQDWLASKVASLIGVSARSLDTAVSFREWGLDSIALVGLTGDLEELLGLELSPALLYEHTTIADLATFLGRIVAVKQAG